ncbi:unnamed protein product, partial [Symbiodinium sp. CCMP2592]
RFDHFRAADLQLRARAPSSSPPWSRAELMRKGRVRFNPPVCEPAAEPILVSSPPSAADVALVFRVIADNFKTQVGSTTSALQTFNYVPGRLAVALLGAKELMEG